VSEVLEAERTSVSELRYQYLSECHALRGDMSPVRWCWVDGRVAVSWPGRATSEAVCWACRAGASGWARDPSGWC
jgi:hypothetical protein